MPPGSDAFPLPIPSKPNLLRKIVSMWILSSVLLHKKLNDQIWTHFRSRPWSARDSALLRAGFPSKCGDCSGVWLVLGWPPPSGKNLVKNTQKKAHWCLWPTTPHTVPFKKRFQYCTVAQEYFWFFVVFLSFFFFFFLQIQQISNQTRRNKAAENNFSAQSF